MSKHTPGPWSTYLNTMDSIVVRKMGVSGYEIAHIAIVRTGIQDARLIAAAPELLEALKAFVNDIVPNSPKDPLWEQARAAIQKAESTP